MTHIFTDGSSEEAVENGGVEFIMVMESGARIGKSIANGEISTNYKL